MLNVRLLVQGAFHPLYSTLLHIHGVSSSHIYSGYDCSYYSQPAFLTTSKGVMYKMSASLYTVSFGTLSEGGHDLLLSTVSEALRPVASISFVTLGHARPRHACHLQRTPKPLRNVPSISSASVSLLLRFDLSRTYSGGITSHGAADSTRVAP